MNTTFVAVLIAFSLWVSLVGAIGVIRMPDLYLRIQASSKTVVLGALPLLVALVVSAGWRTVFGSRALLVAVLLAVMNPLAAHALSRAAYKAGVPMSKRAVTDQVADREGE